jgi:signal transduction histidine kinase
MSRILVIEDEPAIRENIMETLELDGHEAMGAEDGFVGVDAARQHRPDLIICDIMMPDKDGFGVLQELRGDPTTATIPFIFVTARAERDTVRQGMEIGADDYITKPFTPTELLGAVEARLKRQLAIGRDAEKKIESLKQQLMRMVTHELRTPLVSINTVLDIISRQVSYLQPTELQELLDAVGAGSKRLNRVVEQILMLTRLEMGATSRETIAQNGQVWKLWEVTITAGDFARKLLTRPRPDVYVRFTERDKQVTILCEPNLLKQALAEIISNAINFSPENGQVEVTQWLAEGAVWMSVVDNGRGIPADEVATALSEFSQVNREQNEQQGMGLGLPLARRIVEAHGGVLEIQSVVDKGTQVLVGLPLAV